MRPLEEGVVHGSHGHRLRVIPLGGRNDQRVGREDDLGSDIEGDRHIGTRLAGQSQRETVTRAAFRHGRVAIAFHHGDADAVVVGIGDGHIRRIQSGVVGIGAGRRRRDDAVGDIAIDDGIVHAGDGDGLRGVPVDCRERQAGR